MLLIAQRLHLLMAFHPHTRDGGALVGLPGPGFGDSLGAVALAAGMMGAIAHRERTGEATEVDVSLFGLGLWAMGQPMSLALLQDQPGTPSMVHNPLVRNYKTKDGRYIAFICLQAGKYWSEFCRLVGRDDLAADPRFADHVSLIANSGSAIEQLTEMFATRPVAEWSAALSPFSGQWTIVQDVREAAIDPQAIANGYIQDCTNARGVPFKIAAAPVQFGGQPAAPRRAPEFNEHGDAILAELGLDWEAIVDLKVRSVVA